MVSPMNSPKTPSKRIGVRFLGVGAITTILFAGVLIFAYTRPTYDPVYRGKSLSQWLPDLDTGSWPRRGAYVPADEAILQMDTNAFPQIARLLRPRFNATTANWVRLFNKRAFFGLHIMPDSVRYHRALAACYALGWHAEPLVPSVAKALKQMDSGSQMFAAQWLGGLGSDAESAVPALIEMLRNTNNLVRYGAVQPLAHVCGAQRDAVISVLQECLNDTNKIVQSEAKIALFNMGETHVNPGAK
jgi:hypothetical protein